MFKLRRPSVCADLDIVSDSSSASDVSDEIYKGVSINSISEPRPSFADSTSGKWKQIECESSNDVDLDENSRNDCGYDQSGGNNKEVAISATGDTIVSVGHGQSGPAAESRNKNNGVRSSSVTNTGSGNCSDSSNCGSPLSATAANNLSSSSSSSSSSSASSSPIAIMCDRKRKERHESCSQGQEKKVIRSLSHDDPKIESEVETCSGAGGEINFRRSQSNDNFQTKNAPPGELGTTTVNDIEPQPKLDANGIQPRTAGKTNVQEPKQTNNYIHIASGPVDETQYGVGSVANPQYGIVKNMPTNFEAELQRKWERSAQWSSSSSHRKVHGGRSKHRSRSGKSSASSTPPKDQGIGVIADDVAECEDVGAENASVLIEDELHSPISEDSSTSSIESLEELENQEKLSPNISCEEIEADLAEDLSLEQCELADASQSQRQDQLQQQEKQEDVGNGKNLEPVPHLDFSTLLHHQVETNEPIPFLAALQATGMEDQVMLSPRNSVLIKEASDPSIPPSPPLHQAVLDPPVSRQHGGNQNMKMNLLSKQVSNLKRHLKSLEEEYEQLFGYKPSHADKLNQKEMRKCLLQLTKAKRELKEMKEDPANINGGGGLLQIDPCFGQAIFPRNSPEALRSLGTTVKEIYRTMSDKRRANCRPEDPNMMTQSELTEEKNVMQKQLLMLEKRHGRPGSKEEKEIVRSLYDRYRCLKKTGSRLGNIKENSIDLAPILEYETLELPNNEAESNTTSVIEVKKDLNSSGTSCRKGRRRMMNSSEDEDDEGALNIRNEGFTDMPLTELESKQTLAKDEKRRLRTLLRKFEDDFQNATGRPPQKDEKYSSAEMESIYQKYKRCRATVRLLDVLITKRKYPQLLVDMNKFED